MFQYMDVCNTEVVAKITIKGKEDSVVLKAYGKAFQEITGEEAGELSSISLLKAKPFMAIHQDGIVNSIH